MAQARVCSECGESLRKRAPQTKTCSATCRRRRSKRLQRIRSENGKATSDPDHIHEIREIINGQRHDVLDHVVQDELRPVVREAITEDVLRAIAQFVGLTPKVVQALEEDLESDDTNIRQKAYALVARYTLGHPALVAPEDTGGKQLVVNFALPRPDSPGEEPIEAVATELQEDNFRECDNCHESKPVTEFIAGSDRCVTCYEGQRQRARELMEQSE